MITEQNILDAGFEETGEDGLYALEKKIDGTMCMVYCDWRYGEHPSFYAYKNYNHWDEGDRVEQEKVMRQKEVKILESERMAENTKKLTEWDHGVF